MSEQEERLAVQGPRGRRGEQGEQGNRGNPGGQGVRGERGIPGLSIPVRRALVFLFFLSVLLGAGNLFWTAYEVNASQAAIQASQHRGQVMQQRAAAALEVKLCTTFGRLAGLKPPAGDPAKNPSRAFDDNLHVTLDQLGADLGCK